MNASQKNPGLPQLGKVGVWSMELRLGPEDEAREMAAELEELGFGAIWIPGLSGQGVVPRAGSLLDATEDVTVAIGVLGMWSHEPEQLSADHHRLRTEHGGRLLTGIGVSNSESARSAGRRYPGAVTATREYLDRLDQATPPLPREQRLLAALGPKMTRLGSERAAGVHPFLVTPEHIAARREEIGAGSVIAPHQAVVLECDPGRARAAARKGVGMFISFPSYQANLRRLGFGDEDLVPGGSDRLIDAVVAWGDIDVIAERVGAHIDAGADHVAIHVLAADGGLTTRASWREIAGLNSTVVTQAS
jgi:probable F420-dependent oxidoreductase